MISLRIRITFLLFVILLASCRGENREEVFPESLPLNPTSEYIAVFGDIQYYTNSVYIDLFKHSLDWIEHAHDLGYKVLDILHTGDITQSNDTRYEWPHFDNAIKGIANKVPFVSIIGDHDYSWDNALIIDRNSTYFSGHVSFPLVTRRIVSAYEPGRMENIVVKNSIHGERYDFLLLEFGPREEVVTWANEWVSSHPDIHFILINHEYLEKGGGRRTNGLKCKSRLRNTTYSTPDELWDNLIKCNDNIVCVLCGHVGGLYAVTFEENDFGRSVPQIQHNIQSPEYRYDNWLMLWEFPVQCDTARVSIINTDSGEYYKQVHTLFSFRYK